MIAISYVLRTEVAALRLQDMARVWPSLMFEAMRIGGADMGQDIRTSQWGGRNAADRGLNIRSANLYNSITTWTERMGDEVHSFVRNRGATYWFWNDRKNTNPTTTRTQAFGRPTAPYNVTIPARTDVEGRLQQEGPAIYQSRLLLAMEEMLT